MKVTGLITEYNPFHSGHQYHMDEARRLTGADAILVVMSGDFVQRGLPAITDKYSRTRMALTAGADAVIELPLAAATGSAEYFASGAVQTLNACGCVTDLVYGCECDPPELLTPIARLLSEEPDSFRATLLENLRSGVSMVLQNGSLFSGTIADNLRWADPNATLAQMQAACAIARADEYIDRFPDGYETVLEQNAANLSGGQRQRLLIARAILKKPRILILDDSTSAVDMATDEHIRRCLRTALPGATKIIIAQRINSIMSCDRIVVLDQGRLADMGTHQELLSRSHIYRDVYESQMREGAVDHAAS